MLFDLKYLFIVNKIKKCLKCKKIYGCARLHVHFKLYQNLALTECCGTLHK